MAKQDNGIAGGYRGSVGHITGYQWRGIWCLRAKSEQVRNPRTQRQQHHRSAFRERVQLASRFGRVAYKGFHKLVEQGGMTEQNYFIKCNHHAFSEEEGRLVVDWATLCVSEGPVAPVGFGAAQIDEATGVLRVDFERNPTHGRANSDDDVYLFAYCSELEWGLLSKPVARRSASISVSLPDEWAGHEVCLYGFVSDYAGRCSMSSYIDFEQVAEQEVGDTDIAPWPAFDPTSFTAEEEPQGVDNMHSAPLSRGVPLPRGTDAL